MRVCLFAHCRLPYVYSLLDANNPTELLWTRWSAGWGHVRREHRVVNSYRGLFFADFPSGGRFNDGRGGGVQRHHGFGNERAVPHQRPASRRRIGALRRPVWLRQLSSTHAVRWLE